jgi:hypothetical protein
MHRKQRMRFESGTPAHASHNICAVQAQIENATNMNIMAILNNNNILEKSVWIN